MASDNQVSLTLLPAQIQDLQNKVEELKANLDFLVNLTLQERKTLPKMGDKTLAFVEKSLNYAKENAKLVPPYLDVNELEKDFNTVKELSKIKRPLESLVEALDDTIMLAGSEGYMAALVFYNSVKMASKMNFAGTTTIYEDLKKRFTGSGKSVVVQNETKD